KARSEATACAQAMSPRVLERPRFRFALRAEPSSQHEWNIPRQQGRDALRVAPIGNMDHLDAGGRAQQLSREMMRAAKSDRTVAERVGFGFRHRDKVGQGFC